MLSLNAVGRGFILPQLNAPYFVSPHGSSYLLIRVEGLGWWEATGVWRRGGVITVVGM